MPSMDVEETATNDKLSCKPISFRWDIKNFSKVKEARHYSDAWENGPYPWHMLVLPPTVEKPGFGLFIAVKDPTSLPPGWVRCCEFTLHLYNQINDNVISKPTSHKFVVDKADWGWRTYLSGDDLLDPALGWSANDTVSVGVDFQYLTEEEFEIRHPPQVSSHHTVSSYYSTWDSKKETGFVGLLNQGATCYMNSMLQALYHTHEFRRAVFKMDTTSITDARNSIPLAMQRLFYRMHFDDSAVHTNELTNAFGWNQKDVYQQHDVQELNRVLTDNLDTKMKGTPAEGTVDKLFRGKIANLLECLKVDFKKSHPELFYDLSLPVKGCKNIYESFDKYVEKNMLTGDNQYDAPGHGKQDAAMGVVFDEFPPVLQLVLKRFEFDFNIDQMIKVYDKFEFPEVLNLDRYLSADADRSRPAKFILHSILVHSGSAHGGHYFSFIRAKRAKWFKFDDERVTAASAEQAIQDNYGGEETHQYYGKYTYTSKKYSSAYMLIYIRESDLDWILREVSDEEVPSHLHERFAEEKQEEVRKQKEKSEAHLFCDVTLCTEKDLLAHEGTDAISFGKLTSEKVKKLSPFSEYKAAVAEKLQVAPERLRFYRFSNRGSASTLKEARPAVPLSKSDETKSIGVIFSSASVGALYVEVAPETGFTDEQAADFDNKSLVLLKHYDAAAEGGKVRNLGVGAFDILNTTVQDIVEKARSLAQIPADQPLVAYEEISNVSCAPLHLSDSMSQARLSAGDCVVIQSPPVSDGSVKNPSYQNYVDYMHNRVMVTFKGLSDPADEKKHLILEMNNKMKYDEVAAILAQHLNVDPLFLRLTGHISYYDQPRSIPIKRSDNQSLGEMLANYYSSPSQVLYYEVLEVSIADLETKQVAKIVWRNKHAAVEQELKLLVPKDCKVNDVLDVLKAKLEINPEAKLRMFEVWDHRIFKNMKADESFHVYGDSSTWHCEEIPEEESAHPDIVLVKVAHIYRDATYSLAQAFGTPFYIPVRQSVDKGRDVKARIQAKLGVSDEEWATWKIGTVSSSTPKPLEDDDGLMRYSFGQYGDYIGLEHKNTDPRKARPSHNESKPLRITG